MRKKYSILDQIMITTSMTFLMTVTTFYVYCHSILNPGQKVAIVLWIYTGWFMLYITGTLLIIYYSDSMMKEVNMFIIHLQFGINILCAGAQSFYSFIHLQGRRTFQIVHDMINCCNDSELMQSVKKMFKKFDDNAFCIHILFCFHFSGMQLYYLSHQTEHRHPIVTCGLFIFDWTLLFNV